MEYGMITVLPLILMLALVIITKRVFESILVALAVVFALRDGWGFIGGIIDGIYGVLAEETYPWILLVLCLFSGLIKILIRSGSINGFRHLAAKYIKSERSSLMCTWILGVVLFVDDYINNLGIGPTVRTITDKHNVPREQLGFIICSMGTPVCSMIPLTAFAVFIFGVMKDVGISPADASMVTEYAKVLPFMFYPMLIILVAFLLAAGVLPKMGLLKKLGQAEEGQTSQEDVILEKSEFEQSEDGKLIDFLIPVAVLICMVLYTSDVVFSVIIALGCCFVFYLPRKRMRLDDFFKSFFEGITDMVYVLIIVLCMFVFVKGLNDIGFSDYVVETITPYLVGGIIPVLVFIAVGVISFLGVDYWAIILLIMPIAVPLGFQFDVNAYLIVGATASGAVFGGSACFFAEQVLMCAQSVERSPVKVAMCGLPYSVLAFALSAILFLICGFAI